VPPDPTEEEGGWPALCGESHRPETPLGQSAPRLGRLEAAWLRH